MIHRDGDASQTTECCTKATAPGSGAKLRLNDGNRAQREVKCYIHRRQGCAWRASTEYTNTLWWPRRTCRRIGNRLDAWLRIQLHSLSTLHLPEDCTCWWLNPDWSSVRHLGLGSSIFAGCKGHDHVKEAAKWFIPCSRSLPTSMSVHGRFVGRFLVSLCVWVCSSPPPHIPFCVLLSTAYQTIYTEMQGGYLSLLSVL